MQSAVHGDDGGDNEDCDDDDRDEDGYDDGDYDDKDGDDDGDGAGAVAKFWITDA